MRRCAFRWTCEPFVEDFVKTIEDGANADDEITDKAIVGFGFLWVLGVARVAATRMTAMLRYPVSISDDKDASNSNGDAYHFVPAQFVI